MTKHNTICGLTLTALALTSTFASGQQRVLESQAPIPEELYRPGGAPVLTPPPRVVVAAPVPVRDLPLFDSVQFSNAYAKAGKPTMVVLWNRELSDMLEQTGTQYLSVDRNFNRQATVNSVSGSSNTTITAGQQRTQEVQQRGNPEDRINLQLRSSFLQTLSAAGVRLVDRNLVMRKTATSAKAAKSDDQEKTPLDSQTIEMDAFAKHAKMLMEVLNTPDRASPSGWSTYVSIKSLTDGVILMEGYSSGKPPPAPPAPAAAPAPVRYEADPRGGYRQVFDAPKPLPPERVFTVQELGKRIGEETLNKMTTALGNL